jgi:Asp-tRNA(Asn)/Glu-tRNA(Gln) amidotransferase A subunit family amidase
MPDPDADASTRRRFLRSTGALVACSMLHETSADAAPVARQEQEQLPEQAEPSETEAPVTTGTFAEAEKLAGIEFTEAERQVMLENIDDHLQRLRARQGRPLPALTLAPSLVFDPRLQDMDFDHVGGRFQASSNDPGPLPDDEQAIAFAPVTALSHWIRTRRLTSERLTGLYLDRLRRIAPTLECAITITDELALRQAKRADEAIERGEYLGPLHGIPWGAKDLFDTAEIPTTFGAVPYRQRTPETDATVVLLLEAAGAVMVAKLALGALAYNDIWFGGRCRNPWNREQGSSGSSAGSAASVAAGLVGFSLGTETYGSIVSPCMRCGPTGLRPTFGRVGRGGAMPLCWSLDKIGPIARTVEDCMLVLDAINGYDPSDPASIDMPLSFDAGADLGGLRVGYAPAWFDGEQAGEIDRAALAALRETGVDLVEVDLPDWPYDVLLNVLLAESAAAFEDLTRSGDDDQLTWQEPQAWPNTFRQSWFIPAVEYVQVDRFRREVMVMMARRFQAVDALISPSFAASLLLITNNTGHPSLTIRAGFRENGTPRGVTLWGRLFEEGRLCRVGMALERALGVWDRRPDLSLE